MSTMDEPPLSEFEVIRFLENRGGRCTNYDLVSNFRGILNDPRHQAEARLKFKDIINRVAAVVEYQNVKYIELKKEYGYNSPKHYEESQSYGHNSLPFDPSNTSGYTSPLTQNFQPYWRYRLSTNPQMPPSRKSELEAALRSSKPKSLNRSISESVLPDDRLNQSVTAIAPFRTKREMTKNSNVYSRHSHELSGDEKAFPAHLSTESLPYASGRDSLTQSGGGRISSSGHSSTESWPSESGRHSHSLSRDGTPSSGHLSTESWPSESSRHSHTQRGSGMASSGYSSTESWPYESSRHSLPPFRDGMTSGNYSTQSWSEEDSSQTYPSEYRSPSIDPSDDGTIRSRSLPAFKLPKDLPRVTQPPKNNLNESVYQNSGCTKRGGCHEDNYIISSSSKTNVDRNPNQYHIKDSHSPSNNVHTEERSQCFDALSNLETKMNSNRCIPNANNEAVDIFSDPNYLRSVSKLCFSKNKASPSAINPSEKLDNHLELRISTDNQNRNMMIKDRSPCQSLDNSKRPYLLPKRDSRLEEDDKVPPQPPERRRRSLDKCNNSRASDSLPAVVEKAENKPDVKEEKISGKVRDRVQHFDEMEKKKSSIPHSSGKENRVTPERSNLEDDISISVLDPKLKKEWFVKSSQCDYHSLISLLKKEPKLAALKDVTSGYTALHWAAKHGDANVVKLIAGAYKVNPNIRSNGGYTPLHLSSLYKHDMIAHLLIHTYGAEPSIRDYYGKKADQYPDNYIRKVAGSKNIERRPVKQRPLVAKQTSGNSFMRIGSLNLRKARKSTVFASVRGNNRNRGNHSELRFGNVDSVRKRMNKKENLYSDRNCIEEDGDSSYGFPMKKQHT